MQTAIPMVNPIVLRLFFRRFRNRSTQKTTIRGMLKKKRTTIKLNKKPTKSIPDKPIIRVDRENAEA